MEAVAVVVFASLLVEQHHPVVLHGLGRLHDGTHGRQGRHVPLDVAARVVGRGLDERTLVLDVEDAECHLIFWVCATMKRDLCLAPEPLPTTDKRLRYCVKLSTLCKSHEMGHKGWLKFNSLNFKEAGSIQGSTTFSKVKFR